jgi:hypothetical protein
MVQADRSHRQDHSRARFDISESPRILALDAAGPSAKYAAPIMTGQQEHADDFERHKIIAEQHLAELIDGIEPGVDRLIREDRLGDSERQREHQHDRDRDRDHDFAELGLEAAVRTLTGQHDAEDDQDERAAGVDDQLHGGEELGVQEEYSPATPISVKSNATAVRTMLRLMTTAIADPTGHQGEQVEQHGRSPCWLRGSRVGRAARAFQ